MTVDRNAPLVARQEIMIAARREKVWALLTDIERWPEWQSDVSSARLEGPLAPGTVFRWKAKGLGITSTIEMVEGEKRVGWTGDSLGMKAVHIWTLEQQTSGTRVITEESLSGWLASLLKIFDKHFLEKSLLNSLQVLKARVEQG